MNNLDRATAPLVSVDDYKESDDPKKYSLGRLLKNAYDDQKFSTSEKSWSLEVSVSEDLKKKISDST